MDKGLIVDFYANRDGYDTTLHGISHMHQSATLLGVKDATIFLPNADRPPLILVPHFNVPDMMIAIPFAPGFLRNFGQFGGNFIFAADSRFPSDTAIRVFDRYPVGYRNPYLYWMALHAPVSEYAAMLDMSDAAARLVKLRFVRQLRQANSWSFIPAAAKKQYWHNWRDLFMAWYMNEHELSR